MTIFKRKDKKTGDRFGNYRICVFRGKDDSGKKQYHWETFNGNIKQARERETQIKWEIKNGKYVKPGKTTVGDFLNRWLRDYSSVNMSPSTHRVYQQQVKNHITPQLGKYPLTSLTAPIISDYYTNRLEAGLSNTTVIHHRTMLHKAFETAIEWGLLQYNPVNGSTKLKRKRPEMETYNSDESNIFLDYAKKYESDYYPLFVISLHCGIRRSELLGLKWKDVDDLISTISINRSLFVSDHGEFIYSQPKTQKSQRLIPLTPFAAQILGQHYDHFKYMCKYTGIKFNDDLPVFYNFKTTKPHNPNTVSEAWVRIAERAKLKHIPLHGARHTMATIMLKDKKIHPKIVQERLGHSSISTTLDLYSHVIPSLQEDAAKALDEAYKSSNNQQMPENEDCQSPAIEVVKDLHNN